MLAPNLTDPWFHRLDSVLRALNQTLQHPEPCAQEKNLGRDDEDEKNAYMYILFVMILFAITVGSLILGYTRSRKEEDKQSDPYRVYIQERVSMI
ncbi:potassium voltage-gated channel subfamily E member 3-like [Heteronotia binoei]|uniref:potassium voltage-gated channel subfamily E member 3-like n=1 Tax=Heteronotia binoei TaxID=13085 RepID=UPI00292F2C7B|nr:potassium voltage-gated channel subfamily E member 3-like [Heteronotia binoei]XP_060091199.1 potassium voltage-gated channel subfamily E member 3-like [Heteronotia binoei]